MANSGPFQSDSIADYRFNFGAATGNGAWHYPIPSATAAKIKGHVAF